MARKTKTYIETGGRDKGKNFLLTEMPATKAEDWAMRAMLALGSANVEIPVGAFQLGMAALAEIGFMKMFAVSPNLLRPLLAELMECVEFIPNPQKPQIKVGYPELETQVEEVRTLLTLKWEVLSLHMDFSLPDSLSESIAKVLEGLKPKSVIPTSQESSELSSVDA